MRTRHRSTLLVVVIVILVVTTMAAAQGNEHEDAEPNVAEKPYSLRLNIPAFEITLRRGEDIVKRYPVAVGKPSSPSPTGEYTIVYKCVNPTWIPTDGSPPVPPGPSNPLGSRWMGLSKPHYGIHGTNAPSSIGKPMSGGCFRMRPQDAEELYEIVPVGTRVSIVYERLEIVKLPEGSTVRTFADIYRRGAPPKEVVAELLRDALQSCEGIDPASIAADTSLRLASNIKYEASFGAPAVSRAGLPEAPTAPKINQEFIVTINGVQLDPPHALRPENLENPTSLSQEIVHSVRIEVTAAALASRAEARILGERAYINYVPFLTSTIGSNRYITVGQLIQAFRGSYTYTINSDRIAISLQLSARSRDD